MLESVLLAAASANILGAAMSTTNPLLAPWAGPYGGVPAFDKIKVSDFKPGLEAAMADQLREIEQIAQSQSLPDFDNTLAALERTGQGLTRAATLFGVWSSSLSTPAFQKI